MEKWGFVDKTGRKVIPWSYGDAWSFSEGLARVELKKKGFIDKIKQEKKLFLASMITLIVFRKALLRSH